jgi:hypothetical protein
VKGEQRLSKSTTGQNYCHCPWICLHKKNTRTGYPLCLLRLLFFIIAQILRCSIAILRTDLMLQNLTKLKRSGNTGRSSLITFKLLYARLRTITNQLMNILPNGFFPSRSQIQNFVYTSHSTPDHVTCQSLLQFTPPHITLHASLCFNHTSIIQREEIADRINYTVGKTSLRFCNREMSRSFWIWPAKKAPLHFIKYPSQRQTFQINITHLTAFHV